MIVWYDLFLLNVPTVIAMLLLNQRYHIVPPRMRSNWVILVGFILINAIVWNVWLGPYFGYEYTLQQMQHVLVACMIFMVLLGVVAMLQSTERKS